MYVFVWCMRSLKELFDIDLLFLLVDSHNVRSFLHSTPSAISLNSQVVPVHLNTEESTLTPVGSPTVATDPELNSVLLTPSHNGDLVVDLGEELSLGEDTAGVGVQLEGSIDTAGDRTTGEDLGLHVVSAFDRAILGHFPDGVLGSSPAIALISRLLALGVSAVLALLDG
jgi:hypothetical protein